MFDRILDAIEAAQRDAMGWAWLWLAAFVSVSLGVIVYAIIHVS